MMMTDLEGSDWAHWRCNDSPEVSIIPCFYEHFVDVADNGSNPPNTNLLK